MKLPSRLAKSRHGVFYFRLSFIALRWCKNASDFSQSVSGKAWRYLLVPHDEINESKRINDFLQFKKKA